MLLVISSLSKFYKEVLNSCRRLNINTSWNRTVESPAEDTLCHMH
jgi:hypothetical protein